MKTKLLILFFILFSLLQINAQTFKVEGCVMDENKNPLAGASIIIKGTQIGAITDINGKFLLQYNDPKSILVIAFIGYNTEEVEIKQQSVINITLTPSSSELQEVVVVGCARQKRSMMCVSSATSSSQKPKRTKVMYIDQALQGKICGLSAQGNAKYYNPSNEEYSKVHENGFKITSANPLSTFSIDVDKASYSNIRRFINNGQKPPADAVRIEEMINYFDYNYPQPEGEHPFSINNEVANCPWQEEHKLLQIGVQGKKIDTRELPASNLVFLIDVSGSMSDENKLPLLKSAFALLINNLREEDKVAIVVYAGAAGCVLPSTSGNNKPAILEAINSLESGGSTAGGAGIKLAYKIAKENFIEGGNNRVILATDGDFNVGASSDGEMEDLITKERSSGIFLTCLGFGMGNYKDSKLETLADKGNGNYAYIDNIQEGNKTLVSEFGGTLFTIAKDVKIQVEFNPAFVQAYRLIGYENRLLNEEDFKDDTKDAGELGSGHTVTALYEIIPTGIKSKFVKDVNDLKYTKTKQVIDNLSNQEIATVKMRYKKPSGFKSIELDKAVFNTNTNISEASENLRFVTSVAMFGMFLRDSEFKGNTVMKNIIELAEKSKSNDKEGYKAEFVRLVKSSLTLANIE